MFSSQIFISWCAWIATVSMAGSLYQCNCGCMLYLAKSIPYQSLSTHISPSTYIEWPSWFSVEDCTHLGHQRDLDFPNILRRGLLLQQRGELERSTVQALTWREGRQIELIHDNKLLLYSSGLCTRHAVLIREFFMQQIYCACTFDLWTAYRMWSERHDMCLALASNESAV